MSSDPRPLSVLQVSRVGYRGGAERVLLTLAQGLAQRGLDVTVACPASTDLAHDAERRGLGVLGCEFDAMRPTRSPRVLVGYLRAWRRGSRRLLAYARGAGVDVIHVHHPVGALYCLAAARRLRIPLVLHVHDTLPANRLYAAAMRLVAPRVSRFLCVSDAATELLDALGIRDERVRVVPNGVDWSFLEPPGPEPSVTGPGPHIGIFGVLEPRKGQDLFLAAAALVRLRHPAARFWLVGGSGKDDGGVYRRHLEELAAGPDLAGAAQLVGHRDEVAPWMRAMDAVVLASTAHESVGMVLVEAMTLERPTVATRIGITDQLIRDGETGLVAAESTPGTLASALLVLLDRDYAAMGRAAGVDMRARFHPTAFAAAVADLYAEL